MTITINISANVLDRVRRHLLPRGGACEEAAFLFTHDNRTAGGLALDVSEVMLIPPNGFTSRSAFYLELSDMTRADVIKRAHDLGAGLIECHSHPGQRQACFSWSDLHGFDEFVPHVMWRLKGKPYAAVVLAPGSFDALAWSATGVEPQQVDEIVTEHGGLRPTGLTHANWSDIYEQSPI